VAQGIGARLLIHGLRCLRLVVMMRAIRFDRAVEEDYGHLIGVQASAGELFCSVVRF
jgi:hypothetical protein